MYGILYLFKYKYAGLACFDRLYFILAGNQGSEKEQEALKFEVNNLKAKVYDLQESNTTTSPDPTLMPNRHGRGRSKTREELWAAQHLL